MQAGANVAMGARPTKSFTLIYPLSQAVYFPPDQKRLSLDSTAPALGISALPFDYAQGSGFALVAAAPGKRTRKGSFDSGRSHLSRDANLCLSSCSVKSYLPLPRRLANINGPASCFPALVL
jgi:hypothetical protein